jgi:hypothetical protein
MSFDKVEVRVFSGPDQVQVGSNTEPDLIVMNIGPKGDPGAAATVAVGTTTTGAAGTNASVTNSGTTSAAVFNFTIPRGDTGAAGASGGSSTAWRYRAKTNATSGYPTNGHLLWNNATQTSATAILVSHKDDEGSDVELLLSFFLEGQKIFIQNRDDSSQNQVWEITGTPTVTGANTSTAYYTFPVTLVSSAGAAFNNNHSILFGSISAAVNAVTSATTSDGTANLSIADLEVVGGEIYTNGEYSHIYTQGDGAEIFTIGSDAHISTSGANANIFTTGDSGIIYTSGENAVIGTTGTNAQISTEGTNALIQTLGSAANIVTAHPSASIRSTNFAAVESGGASLVDGSMQPCLTWSAGGRNLTIPSGTATTFNTTSYTYGTGAAAAHRTALGLTTLATTTPALNVATFLESPTSANLAAAVTGETGSGSLVFGTSPSLTTPSIAGLTLSGLVTHSGSYSQSGGANFSVAVTTAANLTATGSGTVTVGGAGGTTINGGTLTLSPSDFAYGAGAALAHRNALGVGTRISALASNTSVTNTTTLQTVASLSVVAGKSYAVYAQIAIDGTVLTGTRHGLTFPSSTFIRMTRKRSTSYIPVEVSANLNLGLAETSTLAELVGFISVTVTGTVELQFAQNTANANTTTCRTFTFLTLTELV